jgi:poly-gamma-glutamate capsule biosynthesis protein CapA/YwtB (metallophosphatase superfamily)
LTLTIFLAGDVMTGRGLDQILPHPGDPSLYEPSMTSARDYVTLAEYVNGPVPKPVSFDYPWGDAIAELARRDVPVRIVNLETAVIANGHRAAKQIHYRMNPLNMPIIAAAGVNCCVLANNHMLDWGREGLLETLATLDGAGIGHAGAGHDLVEAMGPAAVALPGGRRVLVFAWGSETSGVPRGWAAQHDRAGINLLENLSVKSVTAIAQQIRDVRRDDDIVIVSIHWGPNWGYRISGGQRDFAHGLIDDADVDIVHGHSSHHPVGIEVYRDRPILYGCGDFLNDYEGIGGYESFRPELVVMYLPTLDVQTRRLSRFEMIPFRIRKFRLERASHDESEWLSSTLDRESRRFGTRVVPGAEDALALDWG